MFCGFEINQISHCGIDASSSRGVTRNKNIFITVLFQSPLLVIGKEIYVYNNVELRFEV